MNYKQRVDLIKDQVIHTITGINDAFHLSSITLGNLIASVPEYFALANTGHHPGLSATFALASVVTATLSATIGGRMWIAFAIQVSVSIGTVWLNGGRVEASWPLVTAIVAISVSEYQKFSKVEQKVDSGIEFEQSLKEKKLEQKHEQAMERIRTNRRTYEPDKTHNVDNRTRARQMRSEGLSPKEIANELGVTDRTVRRYLSDTKADTMSGQANTNGVYAP